MACLKNAMKAYKMKVSHKTFGKNFKSWLKPEKNGMLNRIESKNAFDQRFPSDKKYCFDSSSSKQNY